MDRARRELGRRAQGRPDDRCAARRRRARVAGRRTDKRIDELEIKLKRILDEVEQLRKERKPDAPKSESGPHSYGPAPLIQLPVVGKLFRTEPTRTAEEQARAWKQPPSGDALQKTACKN